MVKFKVGDIVTDSDSHFYKYEVIAVDEISKALPEYTMTGCGVTFKTFGIEYQKVAEENDVLRYGDVLTDDDFVKASEDWDMEIFNSVRIRTIEYDSHIYYHKMVNGETKEFKELR